MVDPNGNVGIGTTDPGTNRLRVEGDIDLTGALKINNKRPIKFIEYKWPNDWQADRNSVNIDSGISYDEYAAAIVGFSSGFWDVNESGGIEHIRVLVYHGDTGTWWIHAREDAHSGSYPDWKIWVMYVHMSLVEGLYGYD